ncbi:MAG TPA: phage portal protein [Gemmatimonadales bacterium]|nr:phage portal protein [Gemmatimonadales bacterium]
MAIDFHSASFRAAQSDLTVAISPLGLVELADEEFEVHGPRLNRYAHNWAWYLGHHWGYRREAGEPQLTFNYCRALSDFTTNFTFGQGVTFRTPDETEGIIPARLRRVWEVDNDKQALLWEVGQLGSVSGDVFVKVAYEDPWADPIGRPHPGRVRIIPLNPAHCFPEFHPHDRSRMIRFKLKYRFWGTSAEGTRQVFTYTELITESFIEEYVNDEIIDQRENPLGTIPIVHIPNLPVSGSPWGLSDLSDITTLNREYNEKATDISDIINYHAAPVTVITGAKASQLEKGPRKVWGGLPKDANVFNLELGANLAAPLEYLHMLKTTMHEMTGVPESALGQIIPISNTSGVALAIQYQPMMQRYQLKKIQYGRGFAKVNELIMLTLALKEPEALMWNPEEDEELKEGQYPVLDPQDPITYQTMTHWPSPMPIDQLVALNEIQLKMGLGLESKRGALRDLGFDFPDEKMAEIFQELIDDAVEQGALEMLKTQIAALVMQSTGMMPGSMAPGEEEGGPGINSAGGADVTSAGQPGPASEPGGGVTGLPFGGLPGGMDAQKLLTELVTKAYGTKLAQRRSPENDTGD